MALNSSNQGAANSLASAWPHKVTDGTNTQAVKAASTPAAATDPAAVVAISPNNTPTVQPGNTANTTPWLMKPHDGTAVLFTPAAASADGIANPTQGSITVEPLLFNGTTWDRQRGNTHVIVDSGVKTVSFSSALQTNYNARGVIVTFNISAISGTSAALTAQLRYTYDGGTSFVSIPGAVTASMTSPTAQALQVYPGVVTTANQSISWALPRQWQILYTISGTTPSLTVNITADYIV